MALARIGKGITYIILLNVLQFLVGIVFYSTLSRELVPAEIGVFSTLTFVYTTLTALAPLALHVAAVRYVAEYLGRGDKERAASVARTVTRVVLLSSTCFFMFFLVLAVLVGGRWAGIPGIQLFLAVAAGAGFLSSLRVTYLSLIQGLQLYDRYAVTNLSSMIAAKCIGIVLLRGGAGLLGAVLGMLLGECVGLGLTYTSYRGKLPETRAGYDTRALFRFSLPILLMGLLATMQDWSDRIFFLATSGNLEALGVFDLVIRVVTSLGVVGAVLDVVVLPTFSESYGRNGNRELSSMISKALRYLGLMYFPAAFGLASISHTAMTVLYQARLASEGYIPLTLLALFSIFNGFSTILNTGLKSMGRTSSFIRISLIALGVDAGTVIVLSPLLGLYGAVVARAASMMIVFVCTLFELKKELSFRVDRDGLAKPLIASLFLVPLLLSVEYFANFPNAFVKLGIEVAIATAAYFTALFLVRAIRREDIYIMKQMTPHSMMWMVKAVERLYVRRAGTGDDRVSGVTFDA